MANSEKTKILLTGKPFQAQVEGKIREINCVILAEQFQFGVGYTYKNDGGKTTGRWWGMLFPSLIARYFRAMKVLESVENFDIEPNLPCYAYYGATISETHSSDLSNFKKAESLFGKRNLENARKAKMSADEIDTLVINLNKLKYPEDEVSFYAGLDFSYEAEGVYPKTQTVTAYFSGTLPVEIEAPTARIRPQFSEVMQFNRYLWDLCREKFTSGEKTLEEYLAFLGISTSEYHKMVNTEVLN